MTIKTIDRNLCDGCEVCIDSCPVDVLRMDAEHKAIVAYPNDCMSCFLCEADCPPKAIYVSADIPLPLLPIKFVEARKKPTSH